MELQLDSFLHRLPIFIQQDEALRKIFFRGQDIALHMSTCLLFADTDSADLPLETAANLLRRTPLCFDDAAAELLPMLSAILATSVATNVGATSFGFKIFVISKLNFPATML